MSVQDNLEFTKRKLVDFYENNDNTSLKKWLYENALDGINS